MGCFLGYEHQEIALTCGSMLRECVKFEALAKILLHSEHFYDFFKYVEVSTFDIASDAFATFKVLLKTLEIYLRRVQCWGPGSAGSACFRASRIRFH
jgi:hypothetical protein